MQMDELQPVKFGQIMVMVPAPSPGIQADSQMIPTTANVVVDLERVPNLDPEAREQIVRKLMVEAAIFDRWLAVQQLPTPMFALHNGTLPDDAAAVLIRDLHAEPARLVVFSEALLDDALFDRAWSDFSHDEFRFPEITGRRVVSIAPHYRLHEHRLDPNDSSYEDAARIRIGEESHSRTELLRRQASDVPVFDVEGIGPVRVLLLPQAVPIDWDALLKPGVGE